MSEEIRNLPAILSKMPLQKCTKSSYSRKLFHYETDADGVCHFSNYLRICEEAFFHSIREGFCDLSFAVKTAAIQYSHPLRFGSKFEVVIQLLSLRRSNFELTFTICENGETKAEATIRFATLNPATWEVIPLPEPFKKRLENYDTNRLPTLV